MLSCVTYPAKLADSWVELVTCIGGFIAAVCAAGYGLYQAREANRLRRSEMLQSILEKYNSDKIAESVRAIGSGHLAWKTPGLTLPPQVLEKMHEADPALMFFADLCYLKSCNLLSKQEFSFFEWKIRGIMADKNIAGYVRDNIKENVNSPFAKLYCYTKAEGRFRRVLHAIGVKILGI